MEYELTRGSTVLGLAIAPDGKHVAYEVFREPESRRSYVGVWSRDRNEVRKIYGKALSMAFSPAGELVVSFDQSGFRTTDRKHFEFYNPATCQRIDRLALLKSP